MSAPMVATLSSTGNSNVIRIDDMSMPINVSIGVVLSAGTTSYTIQYTFDKMTNATDAQGSGLTWYTSGSAQTATSNTNLTIPVTGVRMNASALSGGTLTMTALQAGGARI